MSVEIHVYSDKVSSAHRVLQEKLPNLKVVEADRKKEPPVSSAHIITLVRHPLLSDPSKWQSFFDGTQHGRQLVIHVHEHRVLSQETHYDFGSMSRHRLLHVDHVSVDAIRGLLRDYLHSVRLYETMASLSASMRQEKKRVKMDKFREMATGKPLSLMVDGKIPVVLPSDLRSKSSDLDGTEFQVVDAPGSKWFVEVDLVSFDNLSKALEWIRKVRGRGLIGNAPHSVTVQIFQFNDSIDVTDAWMSLEKAHKGPLGVCVAGKEWNLASALRIVLARMDAFGRLPDVMEFASTDVAESNLVDLVAKLELDTAYLRHALK